MSFCVQFSSLINKLRILKKSYLSWQTFIIQTFIWSVFEVKKIYGVPLKPSELFLFKDTKNFAVLLFFLAAGDKKFQQLNAQPYV